MGGRGKRGGGVCDEADPVGAPQSSQAGARALGENADLFSERELALVGKLVEAGQAHLFADWPAPGKDDEGKHRCIEQLEGLDSSTPGGLVDYVMRARRLLKDSQSGKNPLDGWTPSVPSGENLSYGSESFCDYEDLGMEEAGKCAFVLVAGGLGERLGYNGIKVALPTESSTKTCYLQLYIESILALQERAPGNGILPFVIMTSGDTHAKTVELLESNHYFGMPKYQVKLVQQEKVPCLADNQARLALDAQDSFKLQTKPHGHGDVHALLYQSGISKEWANAGVKWVVFFQDTNAMAFRSVPAALGVSKLRGFHVNSLAVPRKAKEAIGALCKLTGPKGETMTLNVEYNQLDPVLRATVSPEGDVNDPSTGFSPYPGNINQIIISLPEYHQRLEASKGVVPEFVNPKYADSSRTKFKSATRLECMMQDYPRLLSAGQSVGFTVMDAWAAYSPVKNSPEDAAAKARGGNPSHSATSGEIDIYNANCRILKMLGCDFGPPTERTFNGIEVKVTAQVVLCPSYAMTYRELASKFNAQKVRIESGSTLIVKGANILVKGLELHGGLKLDASNLYGAQMLTLHPGMKVKNMGCQLLESPLDTEEEVRIRGFYVQVQEMKLLEKGEHRSKLKTQTFRKSMSRKRAII